MQGSTEAAPDRLTPPSIEDLKSLRITLKNVHEDVHESLSRMDKLALWITRHVGSMGFFLLIALWTVVWLGWNFLAPARFQFDPPMGFVFWLFISNLVQILLMPLIMVGQNVMGAHSEARAEHDLEINIKAEQEIEIILHNIEHQNRLLIAMLQRLGGDINEVLAATRAGAGTPPPG
mgnify:CR=1 FL=1